jgi:hypothetical protein
MEFLAEPQRKRQKKIGHSPGSPLIPPAVHHAPGQPASDGGDHDDDDDDDDGGDCGA